MINLCKRGFIFLILFITPFIIAEHTSQTNLTNDIVIWYHMNNQSEYGENTTNVYDFAGGNNNGSYYEGATLRLL